MTVNREWSKIQSICGCVSYNVLRVPYIYTHPIRDSRIYYVDVQKHESSCEIAQSIRDSHLTHQSLTGPY